MSAAVRGAERESPESKFLFAGGVTLAAAAKASADVAREGWSYWQERLPIIVQLKTIEDTAQVELLDSGYGLMPPNPVVNGWRLLDRSIDEVTKRATERGINETEMCETPNLNEISPSLPQSCVVASKYHAYMDLYSAKLNATTYHALEASHPHSMEKEFLQPVLGGIGTVVFGTLSVLVLINALEKATNGFNFQMVRERYRGLIF